MIGISRDGSHDSLGDGFCRTGNHDASVENRFSNKRSTMQSSKGLLIKKVHSLGHRPSGPL